jgi:hypothetical protein
MLEKGMMQELDDGLRRPMRDSNMILTDALKQSLCTFP